MRCLLFCLLLPFIVPAQPADSVPVIHIKKEKPAELPTDSVYTVTEEAAEFPGGLQALMRYVTGRLNHPTALHCEPGCRISYIRFVIEPDGTVSNVTSLKTRTECPEFSEICIAVIKTLPMWKPARVNGRAVRCYYQLPFRIRIA